MPVTSNPEMRHAARGGAFAGVVGGLASMVIGVLTAIAGGHDIWPGFKGASYPFVGPTAMEPGFNAGLVLLGTLIHYAISVGWGIAFGLLFYGLSRGVTLLTGVLFGVVVWLAMYYIVLPFAGMGFVADSVPTRSAVINHIIFGLALAVGFLPYQRPKDRRSAREAPRVAAPRGPRAHAT